MKASGGAAGARSTARSARDFFGETMQLKMFSIPALDPGEGTEEMNRFLRGHRVLSVEKRLVGGDASAFWLVLQIAAAPFRASSSSEANKSDSFPTSLL